MKSLAFEYLDRSESIEVYIQRFYDAVHADPETLNEQQKEMLGYYTLNWARSKRVEKTYTISEDALDIIYCIINPQVWIVITDGWCGDSSQSLPVITEIARQSQGKIILRIISRDVYPELLEKYQTNGSMSIPKLIGTTYQGEESWVWGPRPKPANDLFQNLKSKNMAKEDIYKELHAWYAKDKGKAVESELMECIR
ncbi:MAG: thioredoxin family protein [Ignavibacteria bacterium]|nr:thioredoxin family protein [Ignavibacteria bacterium]